MSNPSKNIKYLIAIAGPTGVGKTSFAEKLYHTCHWPVISSDSRQMYREMSIGTDKPSEESLRKVPQNFINTLSIHEDYDAGKYEEEALALICRLHETHPACIITGGSGLYLKAVIEGFDAQPKVPKEFRKKWSSIFEKEGLNALQVALKECDPEYYSKVDLNNSHRIIRALAVFSFSGKPFSTFLNAAENPRPFSTLRILLNRSREELYTRINNRVDQMIENGLVEEARFLYPYRHLQALQTVGYRELFQHFENQISLTTAIDKIKQHTRNYAKRQLTWFRNQGNWEPFHPDSEDAILSYLHQQMQPL